MSRVAEVARVVASVIGCLMQLLYQQIKFRAFFHEYIASL